ncbi:GntR family transcriptional regulator, partial [Enterococcus faecium]
VQAHIGGVLASRAAELITDEQLAELERIQDELESAYPAVDHEAAVRLNHAFHRGVNLAAGSPKLAQLMGQITRFALESVYPTV